MAKKTARANIPKIIQSRKIATQPRTNNHPVFAQPSPTRLVASTAARMNLPPPTTMHPETFLEEIAYGVRSLGRLR